MVNYQLAALGEVIEAPKLCKCVVVKRDLSPRFYLERRV